MRALVSQEWIQVRGLTRSKDSLAKKDASGGDRLAKMQDYFHDASVPQPGIHDKATNPGTSNTNLAAAYLAAGYLAVRHA
jgi:hypothetical protein